MATTLANISIKDSSSWNTYLNLIYPVGSIYIAYTSTSPASRFGGTWSQITSRFLYCTTNVNTGGEQNHTLTISEMPYHQHTPSGGVNFVSTTSEATGIGTTKLDIWWYVEKTAATTSVGGGQSHNNMPPYQGVYCWRRTA